jgi:hypothetical protein
MWKLGAKRGLIERSQGQTMVNIGAFHDVEMIAEPTIACIDAPMA